MTSQPRSPAGVRRGTVAAGGRWTSKPVPDVAADQAGFVNTEPDTVGPPNDWTERVVDVWGLTTTFTRTVTTDNNGDEVTTVVSDCDDPSLLLLAKKGDRDYWSGGTWHEHGNDRSLWCADIAVNMLNEGLIATGYDDGDAGIHEAVTSAGNPQRTRRETDTHILTGVVAQLRGLRLIESMMPTSRWETRFGGWRIPRDTKVWVHSSASDAVLHVYKTLLRPPWDNGVPWGSQNVAGHAVKTSRRARRSGDRSGKPVFVGEHNDLLWRALTETTTDGQSPLKSQLDAGRFHRYPKEQYKTEMVTAAALYDNVAEEQLTTGLFDGVEKTDREEVQRNVLEVFKEHANPDKYQGPPPNCRWSSEQQTRIRGFIDTVEALVP